LGFIGNIEGEKRHEGTVFLLEVRQVGDFARGGGDLFTVCQRRFCEGAAQPA
jgi:hypothetical protein